MRSKIINRYTNMVGGFGEFFMENFMRENGIEAFNLHSPEYRNAKKIISTLKKVDMYENIYEKFKNLKPLFVIKAGCPDFLIGGKKIFVECKSNRGHINENQTDVFPEIIKKGFTIFIANLELDIKTDSISVSKISWYEYTLDNPATKGKAVKWGYVKSVLRKRIY